MSTTLLLAMWLDLMHLLLLQHIMILSELANHPKVAYDVLHLQGHENVTFKVPKVLQDKFNVQALVMVSSGWQDFNSWHVVMYCHLKRVCCTLAVGFIVPVDNGTLSVIERQHALAM
jgi:hypothetical protein